MKNGMSRACTATILICWPLVGAASQQIELDLPTYAVESTVAQNIRNECGLPAQLADAIVQAARKTDLQIVQPSGSTEAIAGGMVLQIEIVDALSARSGGPGGHNKYVTVKGQLLENGKPTASFEAHRRSGGGAWGWMKSACTVFARIDKALGADIVAWLKNPVDGAHLGDPIDRK